MAPSLPNATTASITTLGFVFSSINRPEVFIPPRLKGVLSSVSVMPKAQVLPNKHIQGGYCWDSPSLLLGLSKLTLAAPGLFKLTRAPGNSLSLLRSRGFPKRLRFFVDQTTPGTLCGCANNSWGPQACCYDLADPLSTIWGFRKPINQLLQFSVDETTPGQSFLKELLGASRLAP